MHSLLFIPLGVQRLFDVGNNILCILYTYREANQVGAYTCLPVSYTHLDVYKRQDYKEVFKRYKDVPGVVFLVDPPYLSTEVGTYKMYWRLADYLDVLNAVSYTHLDVYKRQDRFRHPFRERRWRR